MLFDACYFIFLCVSQNNMTEPTLFLHTSSSEQQEQEVLPQHENVSKIAADPPVNEIKDPGDQRIVLLIAYDSEEKGGKKVQITREAAKQSRLIYEMLQEDEDDVAEVPLMEIDLETLEKVALFMNHHEHNPMDPIPAPLPKSELIKYVSQWDYDFINHRQKDKPEWLDGPPILRLGFASDYLDIQDLLKLTGAMITDVIKGMDPDEIHDMFNIDRPSPEVDKRTRLNPEFEWALDFHR